MQSCGTFRVAYGETGKEPPPYAALTTMSRNGFGSSWGDFLSAAQGGFGGLYASGTLGNDNLKPERQKAFETGADLGFCNQNADPGITRHNNNSVDVS